MPTALDVAAQYRAELLANDAKALGRLVKAYRNSFDMLRDKLELLMHDLGNGHHTIGQVHQAERYKSLMAQVMEQLRDLQGLTRQEMDNAAKFGITLAGDHARGLIAATLGDERLAVAFNKLNPEAVKALLGFLDPDGALYKRLSGLSKYGADRISQDLVDGIVAGYNPIKIAELFTRLWGMSLTDSMRMTRTVQIKAYQEASRANYVANSDIISGWQWSAELDSDTCVFCISQNGTIHNLDESLDGHYNCRCAEIPIVKGFDPVLQEGSGEQWFRSQPESVQRDMLGPGRYNAWTNGQFNFNDLGIKREDEVYGEMWNEKTLKELIGESQ